VNAFPPLDEWDAALRHNRETGHTLRPYDDADGHTHAKCDTCDFDTARPEAR
jgi:hypothetical protein